MGKAAGGMPVVLVQFAKVKIFKGICLPNCVFIFFGWMDLHYE
jgi:hypothetical protein